MNLLYLLENPSDEKLSSKIKQQILSEKYEIINNNAMTERIIMHRFIEYDL